MSMDINLADEHVVQTLNVMVCPGGATASSFQVMRRPKPATPITSKVICIYAV